MGSVSLVVIVESVRSLATKADDTLHEFHLPSIIAVAAALGPSFSFTALSLIENPSQRSIQLSNSSCFSIAIPFANDRVKFKSYGKTTAMTYG